MLHALKKKEENTNKETNFKLPANLIIDIIEQSANANRNLERYLGNMYDECERQVLQKVSQNFQLQEPSDLESAEFKNFLSDNFKSVISVCVGKEFDQDSDEDKPDEVEETKEEATKTAKGRGRGRGRAAPKTVTLAKLPEKNTKKAKTQ